MTSYYAYDNGLPCRNPNCKSEGKPHPNCRCYSQYSEGGWVGNFCGGLRAHKSECEYFRDAATESRGYAQGGSVTSEARAEDHPATTLGYAAVHHGLAGLMKNVGNAKLADADKHIALLEDAKTQHQNHVRGEPEPPRKTPGHRLGQHLANQDHNSAAESIHGHPVVGSTSKGHLEPILRRLSPEILARDSHPEALRGSVDYLHSAVKGASLLSDVSKQMTAKKFDEIEPDKDARERLKSHMQAIEKDPGKMLDVGGNLGHYLPEHASELGSTSARAVEYLNALKPKQQQNGPLDEMAPVDKAAEAKYHRAIDVINKPLLTLQHVRDGTLVPTDVMTLKNVYPSLYDTMVRSAVEGVISSKSKGEEIPYKQRVSLGLFIGQPLDSTMTQASMQAIIHSAGPQQAAKQAEEQQQASPQELKTIAKTDELYALPSERRAIDKK